jgi:hypothetical protein
LKYLGEWCFAEKSKWLALGYTKIKKEEKAKKERKIR